MTEQVTILGPGLRDRLMGESPSGRSTRGRGVQTPISREALLYFFHNRHIGVTPNIALAYTRLISIAPGKREGDVEADGVDGHIVRILRKAHDMGHRLSLPLFAKYRHLFLLRILMPLTLEACRHIQQVQLFGGTGHREDPQALQSYRVYDRKLEKQIKNMCRIDHGQNAAFWQQVALIFLGLQNLGSYYSPAPIPEKSDPDPIVLGLIVHLEPSSLREPPDWQAFRMLSLKKAYIRQGVRPQQGGVRGIRVSRRMEDIGSALFGEFIQPPSIFRDRLLNTGFLIKHRPPPKDKDRDFLLIGLAPAVAQGFAGRLAKVAWIDAMARVALLLHQAKLKKSHFLWIQAQGATGAGYFQCKLPDFGQSFTASPWKVDAQYRLDFAKWVGWLASAGDPVVCVPSKENLDQTLGQPEFAHQAHYALAKLRLNTVLSTLASSSSGPGQSFSVKPFRFVHLFMVLPRTPKWGEEQPEKSTQFSQQLLRDIAPDSGHAASTLWYPDIYTEQNNGWYTTESGRDQPLIDGGQVLASPEDQTEENKDTPDTNALAGGMVSYWLSQVWRHLVHG